MDAAEADRPRGPLMRVGAGVLYYRFWPDVRPTLDALLAQSRAPEECLVLDNGSADGSPEKLRQAYPDLEVVEVAANRGPTGGMRLIHETLLDRRVDLLLQLTHDTVLAPTALERLVQRLEEAETVGAVGPLLSRHSRPDTVHSAGGYIDRRTWDVGHTVEPHAVAAWEGQPPRSVDWLEGSAILFRASALRDAGPLHEDFFVLFDEPDQQLRMRLGGWRVECVPAAVGWQEPGGYSPYLWVRNRLGFLARNAPKRILLRDFARLGHRLVRDSVRPSSVRARSELWPKLRGAIDFARGRWGRPPA